MTPEHNNWSYYHVVNSLPREQPSAMERTALQLMNEVGALRLILRDVEQELRYGKDRCPIVAEFISARLRLLENERP